MEDVDRCRSRHPPSPMRVTSSTLDPRKHWYVLTKHLCGSRPKEFAKGEVFRHFLDEIQSVDPRYLKPGSGESDLNRQPSYLFVVSSFGLCAGLLQQREFTEGGFLRSAKSSHVVNALNGIKLDSDLSCSFGGKGFTVNPNAQSASEIELMKTKIARLEWEIKELERKSGSLNSYLPTSPPLAASTPSNYSSSSSSIGRNGSNNSNSSSSFIKETLSSPLGPITKQRRVANYCKNVTEQLDGVLGKYHETLACVLGNSFIYGDEEERGRVSDTLSEIVDLVVEAKGSKKALAELLSPETHQNLLESLRIPDWCSCTLNS